jgi:hypothetical protein
LTANYSNSNGKSASTVTFYEGVPGRNGTVTVLGTGASQAITPTLGDHFYYAKVTQNDGNVLWSAPIWVTQVAGGDDLIVPTVSASVSGSSGNITLSANASDDKGVTLVEFYVDGNLIKGTDVTPYSATLDSTKLSNGSHSLVAWAYDASNNIGKSAPVTFTTSNTIIDLTAPSVSASVTGSAGRITLNATASDNVGVTKVEFYVRRRLTLNSTTLSQWQPLADRQGVRRGRQQPRVGAARLQRQQRGHATACVNTAASNRAPRRGPPRAA